MPAGVVVLLERLLKGRPQALHLAGDHRREADHVGRVDPATLELAGQLVEIDLGYPWGAKHEVSLFVRGEEVATPAVDPVALKRPLEGVIEALLGPHGAIVGAPVVGGPALLVNADADVLRLVVGRRDDHEVLGGLRAGHVDDGGDYRATEAPVQDVSIG